MINYNKIFNSKPFMFIREWVEVILIAFAIAIVVKMFIIETDKIYGSSMAPNFMEGEKVLVEKVSYIFVRPKRGDVIVFNPEGTNNNYIKRVIGLSGDVIDLRDGDVYVNDELLEEEYVNGETKLGLNGIELPYEVGEGEYFVMGDNRFYSEDSRSTKIGKVTMKNIKGKVIIQLTLDGEINKIKRVRYN